MMGPPLASTMNRKAAKSPLDSFDIIPGSIVLGLGSDAPLW